MKLWYLRSDIVQPRRLMMLRKDVGGVVHWTAFDKVLHPHSTSHCGTTLAVIYHPYTLFEYPTCLRCLGEDAVRYRQ